jgi:hypothetical protein
MFADLPEALANTLVVAQRCACMPPKRKPMLPSLAGDKEGEARMMVDLRAPVWPRLAPYWPAWMSRCWMPLWPSRAMSAWPLTRPCARWA